MFVGQALGCAAEPAIVLGANCSRVDKKARLYASYVRACFWGLEGRASYLVLWTLLREQNCDVRANEPRPAGHQNVLGLVVVLVQQLAIRHDPRQAGARRFLGAHAVYSLSARTRSAEEMSGGWCGERVRTQACCSMLKGIWI